MDHRSDDFTNSNEDNSILKKIKSSHALARVIIILMTTQAVWSGTLEDLRSKLNDMISHKRQLNCMLYTEHWLNNLNLLDESLDQIVPDLREKGILVIREYNQHNKSTTFIITNNHYVPSETIEGYG